MLETRFPVLLEEFSIRRGSGGAGAWRGGDGATRRIRFLEPMTASILSNRRRIAAVRAWRAAADGARRASTASSAPTAAIETPAASTATVDMAPGDVFVIETPGGGGFGMAQQTH